MRAHAVLAVLCASGATLAAVASTSCVDEVHEQEVAALGSEQGQPGPTHRPGQPCLVCHGGLGPAKEVFSIGGTVYETQGGGDPAVGAVILIEDILGNTCNATSNTAGNFFLTPGQCSPHYPTDPTVTSANGSVLQQMETHVGRDGSCADCHALAAGPTSAGPVYLNVAGSASDGGAE
jgi:hypothetical protein